MNPSHSQFTAKKPVNIHQTQGLLIKTPCLGSH